MSETDHQRRRRLRKLRHAWEVSAMNVPYNAPVRSFLRLMVYVCWIGGSIPVQAVAVLLNLDFAKRFPLIVHRVCVWLMGAKVIVRGRQVKQGPCLFVANHASYADISIIGGQIKGSFVAKQEVAGWPIFGICARLSRCVFVDRKARFALKQSEQMKKRLQDGDSLILFPEGTSSDGNRVLKFRSSLFSAAEIEIDGKPVTVQPVSIAYTHLDGIPMGRHLRPFFAWYGDMEMFSHLWQLVGIGRATVILEFHEPVTIAEFKSRKALSQYCEETVRAGVSSALAGRRQPIRLPAYAMRRPLDAASAAPAAE